MRPTAEEASKTSDMSRLEVRCRSKRFRKHLQTGRLQGALVAHGESDTTQTSSSSDNGQRAELSQPVCLTEDTVSKDTTQCQKRAPRLINQSGPGCCFVWLFYCCVSAVFGRFLVFFPFRRYSCFWFLSQVLSEVSRASPACQTVSVHGGLNWFS